MIDVTDNLKQMEATASRTMSSNFSDSIKMKTNFAMAGGVIGFIYAIANRLAWVNYTIGGLVIGAATGFAVDAFINNNHK